MNTRKRGFPVVATLLAAALVWCWFGLRATGERMRCEDALIAEIDRKCPGWSDDCARAVERSREPCR